MNWASFPQYFETIRTRQYRLRVQYLRSIQGVFRMMPDFLIIGVQKGGTTSLFEYLKEHPQITMSTQKELRFFSKEYHKGLLYYRSNFPTLWDKYSHQRARQPFIAGEA